MDLTNKIQKIAMFMIYLIILLPVYISAQMNVSDVEVVPQKYTANVYWKTSNASISQINYGLIPANLQRAKTFTAVLQLLFSIDPNVQFEY